MRFPGPPLHLRGRPLVIETLQESSFRQFGPLMQTEHRGPFFGPTVVFSLFILIRRGAVPVRTGCSNVLGAADSQDSLSRDAEDRGFPAPQEACCPAAKVVRVPVNVDHIGINGTQSSSRSPESLSPAETVDRRDRIPGASCRNPKLTSQPAGDPSSGRCRFITARTKRQKGEADADAHQASLHLPHQRLILRAALPESAECPATGPVAAGRHG